MRTVEYSSVTWLDFQDPSHKDIEYLQEKFDIHPLAIEEFSTPTYQPRVLHFDGCIFLSLHIPLFDTKQRTTFASELDIIITRDHIITSHKSEIYQLDRFFDELQKSEGKRRRYLAKSPAHVLHSIVELLLNSCLPRMKHISERLSYIDREVFDGKEKEMVFEISVLKRDILNFRRTLKPERAILESLVQRHHRYVSEDLKPYFQDLIGTNIRLWNHLESAKETIEALESTNKSLLSNKLNSTMKVLTIFSAVMLPMTVYSNILAMSANIPFSSNPNAFWIHSGIMLTMSLVTITIFQKKGWW